MWLALLGCPRPIPDHLRLEPTAADAAPVSIVDLASAVAAVVGADPLARSPYLPPGNVLDEIPDAAPLAAFVRQVRTLEAGAAPFERGLQALEDDWRGTAAVPLARGYRLRLAETAAVSGPVTDGVQLQLVGLLTPLSVTEADPTLPRGPLAWLGDTTPVAYGERWVLEGWLGSPTIPIAALAGPLAAPQYDPLRTTALGQLIVARAGGAEVPYDPAFADLRRATRLAVLRAAADRDAEQASWADTKRALAAELGDPDPIGRLLERAAGGLVPAAAADRAGGGALLAITALRWVDRCTAGCAGVDRVETMARAGAWDPEIAELSAAWQAVALKEAVDTLEVGRETVMYPEAILRLADALVGTDAEPLAATALRKARPDAAVWLSVSRAVGADDSTDWEGARVGLGKHLAAVATRAAVVAADPEVKAALERIATRAVR